MAYFHGCHAGRVLGQMMDDDSDIFAYQMLPLAPRGYVNRAFATMQRHWRSKQQQRWNIQRWYQHVGT